MINKSTSEKISVAIACYNGEKYIKQQLQSILNQSLPVDEIIISDDGSSDNSLNVVRNFNDSRIHIHKNIGRHGYCGNFENAISLCTGNFIFITDQDDKWDLSRVEKTLAFFHEFPEADLVFCNGKYIDGDGNFIGNMNLFSLLPKDSGKIHREKYLEYSVSSPLVPGLLMCIRNTFAKKLLPFPMCQGSHDQWILFCALCDDSAYYLNEQLVYYRLHGNNTTGKSKYASNRLQQTISIIRKFSHAKKDTDRFAMGTEMMKRLEEHSLDDTPAYETARRVSEIGKKELDAFTDTRLKGAYKLIHLFCTDMRYRRSGKKEFFLKLFAIIFN